MPRGKISHAEKLMVMTMNAIENGVKREDFFASTNAQAMAQIAGITLVDVWNMACHVYVFRKPIWERDAIRKDRAWDPLPDMPVGVN